MKGMLSKKNDYERRESLPSLKLEIEPLIEELLLPGMDTLRNRLGEPENKFTVRDEVGNYSDFILVKNVAGGASARIYKGYSRNKDYLKPIAIKRIEADSFQGYEDEFQQLLVREKFALTSLSKYKHNITEYYGYYYYEQLNEHWLTMEYCDGGSIYNITKELIDLNQISAILAGILKGLEIIHNMGFIHGDIKSGNILLTYPGLVKICDFGLASKVRGVRNPDLHALGTLDYMAPEQMIKSLALDNENPNAQKYLYDYKIDIWATGIIGLELLLGRTPLTDLRRVAEDEFSFYIANMCKANLDINLGSALGLFFYYPSYHEGLMSEVQKISDRELLCKRLPLLEENKRHLLELLMRPQYFKKKPNPNLEVPKPKVEKLYQINKCLDFISQCLYIRYKWRPSSTQIQKHTFVKSACAELNRLEQKMDVICEMYKRWGDRKKIWRKFPCPLTIHEIYKILEKQKLIQKEKLFNETL